MNKRLERLRYIGLDFLASALAWTLFFLYRRMYVEPEKYGYDVPLELDRNYYLGVLVIPLYWIFIYWLIGSYRNIYKKSRVKELGQTFTITFLGSILIFFFLLVDDEVRSYQTYRFTFLTLLGLQFTLLYGFRLLRLTWIKNRLKNRIIGFPTLMVGSDQKAVKLYKELEGERYSQGYKFKGYVSLGPEGSSALGSELTRLGDYTQLPQLIAEYGIEEVILAVETCEHHLISQVISLLEDEEVAIKVIPDMYDMITGSVRMNYIFGTALIQINPEIMPTWQANVKRIVDITTSLLVLGLGAPLYAGLALAVKLSSPGPIFYRQERIGLHRKPFWIYKFRSMYTNAEKAGPQLSSDLDPRITPAGRFLRKYRLDEFPQFYNVLIGDMSLVGPRPERQFFIDQIVQVAPQYYHLLKVRPGITSWGQIKFGYAENVPQMVERMKFDILYVENMSLAMDLKIIFYTALIMVQGRGK